MRSAVWCDSVQVCNLAPRLTVVQKGTLALVVQEFENVLPFLSSAPLMMQEVSSVSAMP